MYQPTDLKKGTVCQIDGKPYRVVEYGQKVMGRGGSIVNVKLKNLIDGSVIPKTFKGQDKIEPAEVNNKTVQYLYRDDETFYFMDPESFEQFELNADIVDAAAGYLKEGNELSLQFFDGKVINVELPKNLYLEVTYAEDVVKGDTTSSVLKDATLETGMTVKVPAFIKVGDVILSADWQLDRNSICLQTLMHHLDNVEEVRAGNVHLVDIYHARNMVMVGLTPDCLGLRLNAAFRAHDGN